MPTYTKDNEKENNNKATKIDFFQYLPIDIWFEIFSLMDPKEISRNIGNASFNTQTQINHYLEWKIPQKQRSNFFNEKLTFTHTKRIAIWELLGEIFTPILLFFSTIILLNHKYALPYLLENLKEFDQAAYLSHQMHNLVDENGERLEDVSPKFFKMFRGYHSDQAPKLATEHNYYRIAIGLGMFIFTAALAFLLYKSPAIGRYLGTTTARLANYIEAKFDLDSEQKFRK